MNMKQTKKLELHISLAQINAFKILFLALYLNKFWVIQNTFLNGFSVAVISEHLLLEINRNEQTYFVYCRIIENHLGKNVEHKIT